MPLTAFQSDVARLLSKNRTPDSYLAGGAALHLEPNSRRFSNDLDYFHDSVERVASAFAEDAEALQQADYSIETLMKQPGFIRAIVRRDGLATKIEWAHDSAWRFLPTVEDPVAGFVLHPIDLAINKVLALAGRDESRDFLDVLHVHEAVLSLGAACWAASGKDPGFTPLSLLSLLRRRGKYRPEDFAALMLTEPPDLPALKTLWLDALDQAEAFIRARPPEEVGCLYYSRSKLAFVGSVDLDRADVEPHHGRPGGVLPRCLEH
jgi:hypothetical protein